MGLNTLVTPAYGGQVYYPAANSFIVLQGKPKPSCRRASGSGLKKKEPLEKGTEPT
jgi:hypothetical protein